MIIENAIRKIHPSIHVHYPQCITNNEDNWRTRPTIQAQKKLILQKPQIPEALQVITTILHMSTTQEGHLGYVTKGKYNSEWVDPKDEELFIKRVQEAGCLIVGGTTAKQYGDGEIYPVADPDKKILNIVLTREEHPKAGEGLMYVHSLKEALALASERDFDKVIIAGGARVSRMFLEEDLLDEIFLTVHPFTFKKGKKIFEGIPIEDKFQLVSQRELSGRENVLVELHFVRRRE